MNHFKKHMQDAQEQAKQALTAIIRMNISKYVIMQKTVNDMLTSGQDLRPVKVKGKKQKDHKCGFCTINTLITKMAVNHHAAQEAANTYKMLFNSEIDMEEVVSQCVEHEFGKRRKGTTNIINRDNVIMPEDAPEEVREICDVIQNVLKKHGLGGKEMQVEVINLKDQNYGLDPRDFENFGEYAKAVSKAREEAHAMENGDKTPEDVIKDAVIRKVENQHFDENKHVTDEKLN